MSVEATRITATTIQDENQAWGGLFDAGGITDGAGNTFECHIRNAPDVPNQAIAIVEQYGPRPDRTLQAVWEVLCPSGTKADSVGLWADPFGADVEIRLTGHRSNVRQHRSMALLQGVHTPHARGGGGGGGGLRPLPVIPPDRQTFQDVPPNSPFWLGIETYYAMGVASGYPCGTRPDEPCDAQSRPYFRPHSSLTRGQDAKININILRYIMGG